MGHTVISEILATVSHNLAMGSTILDCSLPELNMLPADARQKLILVQMGLTMAIDALNSDELAPWVEGELCTLNSLSAS